MALGQIVLAVYALLMLGFHQPGLRVNRRRRLFVSLD